MPAATNEVVRRKLGGALTVQDLVDELKRCDPAALVAFESDYGDRSHTRQLSAVSNVDELDPLETTVYATAYSASGLAVRDADGDEDERGSDDPTDDLVVVVLS